LAAWWHPRLRRAFLLAARAPIANTKQITTFRSTPLLEKFSSNAPWSEKQRLKYLPLAPADPHPDTGERLQTLTTGRPLSDEKQSYVRLEDRFIVPLGVLEPLHGGTARLTAQSLALVRQKILGYPNHEPNRVVTYGKTPSRYRDYAAPTHKSSFVGAQLPGYPSRYYDYSDEILESSFVGAQLPCSPSRYNDVTHASRRLESSLGGTQYRGYRYGATDYEDADEDGMSWSLPFFIRIPVLILRTVFFPVEVLITAILRFLLLLFAIPILILRTIASVLLSLVILILYVLRVLLVLVIVAVCLIFVSYVIRISVE